MVLSILSLNFNRGLYYHSKWLLLICTALVLYILGIVIPALLPPEDEGIDGFPYIKLPFYLTGFLVAAVFPLIL